MMRTLHIALFTATVILLASCVKESIENESDTNGGRLQARITLQLQPERIANGISEPAPSLRNFSPMTRATPTDESLISDLHVLVFNNKGVIVSNEHFAELALTGYNEKKVSINTTTGTGMQIYVIANGDVNDNINSSLDGELSGIATLEQLQNLLVTVKDNGLSRSDRLTMVGFVTVNISQPHTSPVAIPLYYLSAKVTLTITDATPEDLGIAITGWDVVNIPKKTYLLQRNPADDAVDGSTAGDYTNSSGKYTFEGVDAATKSWSQSIYCFENLRGKRVDREGPTDPVNKYPGMSVNDSNQRGKAWYAPAGATCMLVYGTYTKDGQTNQVVYKIFLGGDAISDYNIQRSKHYNYNVTIKGLNDINVDTNVEWGSASFSVDHSDNLDIDAHPDFRVFRIAGTAVDATTSAYATVEVFESDGTTPASWLGVSPLNLYRHSIKQAGEDGDRQQFAQGEGVGSYVRAKYTAIPTSESTFEQATFGMTRKLTQIPFVQPGIYEYQNIIVYADAFDTPDAIRKGKVCITYYKGDGQEAGRLTYDLTQSGPIMVSDDLFMERYEESAMLMHPGLASGLQKLTTMMWGYYGELLYGDAALRYSNGNYLTANAVYNNVQARNDMDAPQWDGSEYAAYRSPYSRTGAKIPVPTTLSVADAIYFYPALTTSTSFSAYFHPIFNSSAARYCHEKNRDTDGDGAISAAETVWYLPSFADMWYIAQNPPQGTSLSGTYWTSTEETTANARTYTFPAKTTAATSKNTLARVRCVRGKGAVLPDATIESTQEDKLQIALASTSSASGAFDVADVTPLTWTVASSDATWLRIATSAGGSNANENSTGTMNKTLYAYATSANPSTTDARTGTITLTRPGMPTTPPKTIVVSQARTIPPSTVTPTEITLEFLEGSSAAVAIDNVGTGLQWTLTSNTTSWLVIAPVGYGTAAETTVKGSGDATVYVRATSKNTSTYANRTGTLTFSRADQANITVTITQKYTQAYIPPTHQGWAGCNVYWDAAYDNGDGTIGRLTFTDVGDESKQRYQGVFFRATSLTAIKTYFKNYSADAVLFSPSGAKPSTLLSIPTVTNFGENNMKRAFLLEIHDPSNDVGDVCKYITDRGWAPGALVGTKWRVPTRAEFSGLAGFAASPYTAPYTPPTVTDGTQIMNRYTYAAGTCFVDGATFGDSYRNGTWYLMDGNTGGAYYGASWATPQNTYQHYVGSFINMRPNDLQSTRDEMLTRQGLAECAATSVVRCVKE